MLIMWVKVSAMEVDWVVWGLIGRFETRTEDYDWVGRAPDGCNDWDLRLSDMMRLCFQFSGGLGFEGSW